MVNSELTIEYYAWSNRNKFSRFFFFASAEKESASGVDGRHRFKNDAGFCKFGQQRLMIFE